MGDVVLLELLKARGLLPKFDADIDAFCLIEDEELRPASLQLIHDLREQGYAIEYSFTPAKSDKQFKRAVELNANFSIKLELDLDGKRFIKIKNLKTRSEEKFEWEKSERNTDGLQDTAAIYKRILSRIPEILETKIPLADNSQK
jgi:histidyl-tRNA synthetase